MRHVLQRVGGDAGIKRLPRRTRSGEARGAVVLKGSKNCAANQFGDLRDYGVSEGRTSVHDVGKPISHSSHAGFGRPRNMSSSRVCDFWPFSLIKYLPVQVPDCRGELPVLHGVGHNPYSIAEMWGASVGSWNAVPLRVIPERGQIGEDDIEAPNKESWRVFQDDEQRSKFANQTGDFGPKARASSSDALAPTGQANVLTGETGCNDVDTSAAGAGKGADIVITGNIGPVLGEDFARERFDFAEGDGLETACSFKAKAKPSDAREKIEDAKLGHAASPVARACATTGESIAASSAPCVTRSAASANSGGQGLSLSCVILPLETPMAAASWLRFIASGRLR
jgi:hypothetical protein